jgi:diaminohydroxyphosphoribosylaminopyrimidine deaminase / 5-amino-6-(5-phosphoribosylamino)uracil reductase
MSEAADHEHMARAIELAARASASSDPNPAVGCVIVRDGHVVGEGFTQRAGGNHAEIEALDAAGSAAAGSTVYVSLEPCAHTGRTGPCAAALIRAGVARVVYALKDPNSLVAGRGAAMLAEAGIETESPLLADEAEAVNRGFFSRHRRGRPWISLKMAASLDGRTALANGESQWITGEAARHDVHRARARASAVMTGIGTVLADDPSLSARVENADIDIVQPKRVILDSTLKTPPTAHMFGLDGEVWIFTGIAADGSGPTGGGSGPAGDRAAAAARFRALEAAGARIETVPADPRCDLGAVVSRLAALQINTIWLESGPVLSGAMLAAGLVDELVLYFSPMLLGESARGLLSLPPIARLADARRLVLTDVQRLGEDLRIIAIPKGESGHV